MNETDTQTVATTDKPPAVPPVAQVDEAWTVETERYVAKVDALHGGAIKSLLLKDGDRRVETLGDGIHWWVGQKPQITQESFGALPIDSTSGVGTESGDVQPTESLGAFGKTVMTEVGVDPTAVDSAIVVGKVVAGALM